MKRLKYSKPSLAQSSPHPLCIYTSNYILLALQQGLGFFSFHPTAMTIFLHFTKRIHQPTYATASFEDISVTLLKMYEILGGGKRSSWSTRTIGGVRSTMCSAYWKVLSSLPLLSLWFQTETLQWAVSRTGDEISADHFPVCNQFKDSDWVFKVMARMGKLCPWTTKATVLCELATVKHECWALGIWLWN